MIESMQKSACRRENIADIHKENLSIRGFQCWD